jgi:hypothetical protein
MQRGTIRLLHCSMPRCLLALAAQCRCPPPTLQCNMVTWTIEYVTCVSGEELAGLVCHPHQACTPVHKHGLCHRLSWHIHFKANYGRVSVSVGMAYRVPKPVPLHLSNGCNHQDIIANMLAVAVVAAIPLALHHAALLRTRPAPRSPPLAPGCSRMADSRVAQPARLLDLPAASMLCASFHTRSKLHVGLRALEQHRTLDCFTLTRPWLRAASCVLLRCCSSSWPADAAGPLSEHSPLIH